ncbi:putative sulfate exporter family transporter [bacterium]|nr:putative sulfate exporter family transporter [bacterium]
MTDAPNSASTDPQIVVTKPKGWNTEDWWSVAIGFLLLLIGLIVVASNKPDDVPERLETWKAAKAAAKAVPRTEEAKDEKKAADDAVKSALKKVAPNPLASYIGKLSEWKDSPKAAFLDKSGKCVCIPLLANFGLLGLLFGVGSVSLGRSAALFVPGFIGVSLLAILSQLLADQAVIKHYGLEYALWALVVGLIISNTIGTPKFLMAAANTEFYIKTGLVLLGAEVLFDRLLALGLPGVFVAWVVTPIVLITTFIFGQRVLKMESPSLNMVISADMSVCGVSAAIATAAACKAKKEELSLAIGLSLSFTVIMMVVMPAIIKAVGMSSVLGGAWIGGTIDSTGAVAAAGGMLDSTALEVAATVKMIQNILIGVVAFGVAVYWVTCVERKADGPQPKISEIWQRFPRFILGFLLASAVFSFLSSQGDWELAMGNAVTDGMTKTIRGWCFCLAFVSIGLETNFRELAKYFAGGKPLILYVCGQALNLALTLFMAWLMFEKIFPQATATITQ